MLWFIQQQTIAALRKSTSNKIQSTAISQNLTKTKRGSILQSPENSLYTPISLPENNTDTILAIQQTLLGLQGQREAIGITINALQHCLNFLLKSKIPR